MYVGGVELLRNLPLCGGGSSSRVYEIKRAGDTFLPDNRQVMGSLLRTLRRRSTDGRILNIECNAAFDC